MPGSAPSVDNKLLSSLGETLLVFEHLFDTRIHGVSRVFASGFGRCSGVRRWRLSRSKAGRPGSPLPTCFFTRIPQSRLFLHTNPQTITTNRPGRPALFVESGDYSHKSANRGCFLTLGTKCVKNQESEGEMCEKSGVIFWVHRARHRGSGARGRPSRGTARSRHRGARDLPRAHQRLTVRIRREPHPARGCARSARQTRSRPRGRIRSASPHQQS